MYYELANIIYKNSPTTGARDWTQVYSRKLWS